MLSERQCNRGVLIDERQVGTEVLWYIGLRTEIATRAGFVGDSFPNTTGRGAETARLCKVGRATTKKKNVHSENRNEMNWKKLWVVNDDDEICCSNDVLELLINVV